MIAAINGPAAGAGLALALACDLRLAAASASLVPAFGRIGLVPDSGLSHTLPRLIGSAAAFDWIVSGRRIGAPEAEAMGLVTRVVEDADLPPRRPPWRPSRRRPTAAIGLTKR